MNRPQEEALALKTECGRAGGVERRREPRMRVACPVYIQPADPQDEYFEEVRSLQDFSRSGFYFITDRGSYWAGMQLYVTPAAFGCLNLEYVGEVVRIERLPGGKYGVAVRLLRIGASVVSARTPANRHIALLALTEEPL